MDWAGCAALQCTKCKIRFCSWCLKESGATDVESHQHVANCPENQIGRGYNFSESDFPRYYQYQYGKMKEKLAKYWEENKNKVSDEDRSEIWESIVEFARTKFKSEDASFIILAITN